MAPTLHLSGLVATTATEVPNMANDKRSPYIDTRGIAATIGGSESTARHWIATGQLASVKIGRRRLVRREVAAAFLKLEPHELAA